jgi:acyl-coenzyme A thioesterase PaaI-like protein
VTEQPTAHAASPGEAAPARTFDDATAIAALGEGRFEAQIDAGWSTPIAANGGYLAAILVRAIQAHADPAAERQLRSLTCHFLRPVPAGPMEVEVQLLRSGRRVSNVRAVARQQGKDVIQALAALVVGDLPAAGTWTPEPPPAAPAPARGAPSLAPEDYRHTDGSHWLGHAPGMPPMFERVKIAPRFGGIPFSSKRLPPGEAPENGGWIALPEPHPVDAPLVALCTDVWWPPGFQPLGRPAIAPTIDLTIHVRADIPPGGLPDAPVLGCYRATAAKGGLMEEDARLFLPDGTLLAHARQLAIFMPIDG